MERRLKVRLEFEPRDLWIGIYWESCVIGKMQHYDVWVCIMPTLPIHIMYAYTYKAFRG